MPQSRILAVGAFRSLHLNENLIHVRRQIDLDTGKTLCGPSADPIPANISETSRIPPPPPGVFVAFRHIRGNARTYGKSGRTVQVGLVMRFFEGLRSVCGLESRVVPRPAGSSATSTASCGPLRP
jgi:hypothetical protein